MFPMFFFLVSFLEGIYKYEIFQIGWLNEKNMHRMIPG